MARHIALVTGAASGLGRATAARLAKHGAQVLLCDLAGSDGSSIAQELGKGASCAFHTVDVTSEDDIVAALDAAEATFGAPPNVVVNCAGVLQTHKTVGKQGVHPLALFQQMINVNTVGTFNVARLAAERMIRSIPRIDGEERGVIINTASIAAFDAQMGQAAYAASKGAVVSMTLPLARDLASFGIRVNTIAPGLFKTPMLESLPDRVQQELGAAIPFPSRLGDPDEYAQFVQVIIDNKMLNGETIRLDGAFRLPNT